jgi:hypothetical protein
MATRRNDPLLMPSRLVAELVGEEGYQVRAIRDRLGITPARLAELTGRTTESVAGLFDGRSTLPRHARTRQVLGELVELIRILEAEQSLELAPAWFFAPLSAFGGKSPFEMVRNGEGRALIARFFAQATGNAGG